MINHMSETLIGFDARIVDGPLVTKLWPKERRDSYLLRTDARLPVSVDTAVLPSAFAFGEDSIDTSLGQMRVPGHNWHRSALRLWDNLAEMISLLRDATPSADHRKAVLAITAADSRVLSSDVRWIEATREPLAPRTLDANWLLLGYDLTDRFFLSGLSNCGLSPSEYRSLRPKYAPQLNDFALFSTLGSAKTFLNSLDQLVAEHAPFYPFGIWQLRELELDQGQ